MIFISHAERDAPLAAALKNFFAECIDVAPKKIFCTCIHDPEQTDNELPYGRLKEEISESSIVFAIVTQDGVSSGSVLFELGAAWILANGIFLICLDGSDFRDLPGPLSAFPCVDVEDKDAAIRIMGMCRDAAAALGVGIKRGPKVVSSLTDVLDSIANRKKDDDAEYEDEDEDEERDGSDEETGERYEVAEWRGSDYCEISFMVDGIGRKDVATVRIFWDDVFMTIAQNTRKSQDEPFVASVLLELCRERDPDFSKALSYRLMLNPEISPESFALIMSRLSSMGFIGPSQPPHTVFQKQARGTFWKLTHVGEEHLRSVIAGRRKLQM